MDTKLRQKIREQVSLYKKLFPGEYKAVCALVLEKRQLLQNKSTGAVKGDHVIERPLVEYPETLYYSLFNKLEPSEFTIFMEVSSQHWFAKEFPEFRIPENV